MNRLQEARVDQSVMDVVERSAHKNPMFRYKTAGHFLQAFRQALPNGLDLSRGTSEVAELVAQCNTGGPPQRSVATTTPSSDSYYQELSMMAARKKSDPGEPQRTLSIAASVAAPSEPDISSDISCIPCGYNLRGLGLSGRCPECGKPVSLSVYRERLIFAEPGWLAGIARGLKILYWTGVIFLSAAVIFALSVKPVSYIPQTVMIATYVTAAIGVFKATAKEPRPPSESRARRRAYFARLAFALFLLLTLLSSCDITKRPADVGAFATLLWAMMALFGFMNDLLRRVPDRRSVNRSRILIICAVPVFGIFAVSAALGHLIEASVENQPLKWLAINTLDAFAMLIIYVMLLGHIRLVRRKLAEIRATAIEPDSVFGRPVEVVQ